jgi:hypothetical protein
MRHAPLVEDRATGRTTGTICPRCRRQIDLLVIDGPPWTLNPFVRGRAEVLFDRIVPGGMVLLDDAARPGERVVAQRWKRDWPGFPLHAAARRQGHAGRRTPALIAGARGA